MEINITEENNQNSEQITDIKDEQKLKDILGETKSQEDNNPKIENENIEKNNDNDIMIKELEKIEMNKMKNKMKTKKRKLIIIVNLILKKIQKKMKKSKKKKKRKQLKKKKKKIMKKKR